MKYYQNIFDIQMFLLENEFDIIYDTVLHNETYDNGRITFSLSEEYNFLLYSYFKDNKIIDGEINNPSIDDVKKILRLDKLIDIKENINKKQVKQPTIERFKQVRVKNITFLEKFYKKMFK